jgi:phage baseplate assembly protein gpV
MKRIDGVAVGLVSQVDARLGRIKVKFPWMNPPQVSHWAPIASLLSGKKRGARFMPEIDDEALVGFDRGEFDHPYIIGFLWNGADEAPDATKSNRVIVTPGGHELRFEDKDGDRRVVLKTADGHRLALEDKDKSVTLESKQGHRLEILDQSGKVTLATKSGGKVTLDDLPGQAVVEASQNKITIGPTGITIDVATGVLNIKSSAITNLEAQGMVNLKSSALMNVQANAVMSIQAAGLVNLSAAMLNVTAPVAMFSGVVMATAVITTSVVSSSYTPGLGNLL